jgi:cytidyltransferase-like protein
MKSAMSNHKIWTIEECESKIKEIKNQGKTIVFTNGCFDIIHAGHVHYLNETSQLADFMIVAINSDESVQRMEKSPARPLQNQVSRSLVMSAFEFVDAVVIFNEDTPLEIIQTITPNVLVKGGDYTIDTIVGADWVIQHGGQVKTIEFVPGFSTTAIEKKILAAHQI